MFKQLDARGPRLVAQKAIETFLGEALLPAPDAEARSATEQSTVARASDSILMGLIFDDRGNRMTPTYAVKKGARYPYYVSSALRGGPGGAANAQGAPTTTMRPLPGRED